MSPELATRTTDPDTQPLPRRDPGTTLDALVAELAIAEKWPTTAGWCARCGFAPCHAKSDATPIPEDDGTCSYDLAEPLTLDVWLNLAAGDAMYAVFRHIPDHGVRRSTRAALGRQLGERITNLYGSA